MMASPGATQCVALLNHELIAELQAQK